MGLEWVDKILRSLARSLAHTPHRVPIIPAAVDQTLTPGIEVQFPRVGGRVPRSRPIVAVRAYVVHGRIVAVTGDGEEHRFPIDPRGKHFSCNPCSVIVICHHYVTIINQLLALIIGRHPPVTSHINMCCILLECEVCRD